MYRASEELVQIFLQNGFNEITGKRYPEHAQRIKKQGYNPNAQKRAFIVDNRMRNVLTFDYISIVPYYRGGCNGGESRLSLTADELKSIIAFYKLPAHAQSAFTRDYGKITDLSTFYKRICESPDLYKRKSDQRIKAAYENVIL